LAQGIITPDRVALCIARWSFAMIANIFIFPLLFAYAVPAASQQVYKQPVFDVENNTGVTYAEGLVCSSNQTNCKPVALQLDVYQPRAKQGGPAVPSLKPAYILAHGGGNSAGSKERYEMQWAAAFYASRGFVGFNIDYRLAGAHGLLPSTPPLLEEWRPSWSSGYPAVRDCKAAVRFVRANAKQFGVDPDRISVSGGSAGATDMLTVGVSFDGDYKDEITLAQDPTLETTHLNESSRVQCVVAHWSSNGEIDLIQQHDPLNRTRYSKNNAPVIEFHGNKDTTIPIGRAQIVQAAYKETAVDYELHVLQGCGHAAWCYDGRGSCTCKGLGRGYDNMMDTIALPFVAKHLKLSLVDHESLYV